MAFSWTSVVAIGADIEASHFTEIQDKIDYVHDNLNCSSENSTNNSSKETVVDNTYLGSVDNGDYSGNYGTDYSSVYSTVLSAENSAEYGSVDTSVESWYCGVHDYTVE